MNGAVWLVNLGGENEIFSAHFARMGPMLSSCLVAGVLRAKNLLVVSAVFEK